MFLEPAIYNDHYETFRFENGQSFIYRVDSIINVSFLPFFSAQRDLYNAYIFALSYLCRS